MTTQRHEIIAYLGDAHDELTSEQVDMLVRISDEINARHSDEDDRRAAFTTAVRLMLDDPDSVLAELARARTTARFAEREALVGLRQAATQLIPADMTESGFGRKAGIDRMAVRAWLGKS